MGRGQSALPQHPTPVQQPSRSSSDSEPPTESLAKMSVGEKPKHPSERLRRPTISKIGTEGTP